MLGKGLGARLDWGSGGHWVGWELEGLNWDGEGRGGWGGLGLREGWGRLLCHVVCGVACEA